MCPDETNEFSATEPSEPTEAGSESVVETTASPGWSRRTFLKAAALGTAAATLLNKSGEGLQFGPLAAYADDLSNKPCTANDINVGTGAVTNEACTCSGTFTANVSFPVTNNT